MWHFYILKCIDDSFYTGCTGDIKERLKRHEGEYIKNTSSRLPIELVSCISFKSKYRAFDFEKYLKSGTAKAFANNRLL